MNNLDKIALHMLPTATDMAMMNTNGDDVKAAEIAQTAYELAKAFIVESTNNVPFKTTRITPDMAKPEIDPSDAARVVIAELIRHEMHPSIVDLQAGMDNNVLADATTLLISAMTVMADGAD